MEKNKFEKKQNNAFTTHLRALSGFNLPPDPRGLIKRTGRNYEFHLPDVNIGENYAAALAKSI